MISLAIIGALTNIVVRVQLFSCTTSRSGFHTGTRNSTSRSVIQRLSRTHGCFAFAYKVIHRSYEVA